MQCTAASNRKKEVSVCSVQRIHRSASTQCPRSTYIEAVAAGQDTNGSILIEAIIGRRKTTKVKCSISIQWRLSYSSCLSAYTLRPFFIIRGQSASLPATRPHCIWWPWYHTGGGDWQKSMQQWKTVLLLSVCMQTILHSSTTWSKQFSNGKAAVRMYSLVYIVLTVLSTQCTPPTTIVLIMKSATLPCPSLVLPLTLPLPCTNHLVLSTNYGGSFIRPSG